MVGFLKTLEDFSLLRKLNKITGHAYKLNTITGRTPEMKNAEDLGFKLKKKALE